MALTTAGCGPREDTLTEDLELAAEVRNELQAENLDERVAVTTRDGVVTLSGQVASAADRMRAEATAARVDGVEEIQNRLEVRMPPPVGAPPPEAVQ